MNQQVQPLQLTSLIRGNISWDLSESLLYTPGETITITLTITNPTEERRIYALPFALIRSGIIVSVGLVTVDDISSWRIDGGETEEIIFELSPEITDCYLNISLLGGITLEEEEEEVIEEIIDSLTTYLYFAATPTVQPLAVQAQWFSAALIGFAVATGIMLILPKIVGAVKEKEKE